PIRIERHDRAQFFGNHGHECAAPPLTSIFWPVIQDASSPSNIITVRAISSGSRTLTVGVRFAVPSLQPGVSRSAVTKPVETRRGATQSPRFCRFATARVVEKAKLRTANFVTT